MHRAERDARRLGSKTKRRANRRIKQMSAAAYLYRRPTVGKHVRSAPKPPSPLGHHQSPDQLAARCLLEAGTPEAAIALAQRHAHGRKLRETIMAIGSAFLRA